MRPGTTFEPSVWVRALQGEPPDAETLLGWRLTPPRIVTREAIETGRAAESLPRWDDDAWMPIDRAATLFAVSRGTILDRCRRWGIPRYRQHVGGRRSRTVVSRAGWRLLTERSVRPFGPLDRTVAISMARGATRGS